MTEREHRIVAVLHGLRESRRLLLESGLDDVLPDRAEWCAEMAVEMKRMIVRLEDEFQKSRDRAGGEVKP